MMCEDPWVWLESLDWSNPKKAHDEVADWLQKDFQVTSLLIRPTVECNDADLAAVAQRSHETSTHYKWFVAASPTWRWQVWLHRFKDPAQQQLGYAITPHDHRYWFTAAMLHGGYRNTRYDVTEIPRIIDEELVVPGSAYTLSPDIVHSISEVKPGTITIVIRGRGVRPYSVQYLKDGTQIHHKTLRSQLAETRDLLRSLAKLKKDTESPA